MLLHAGLVWALLPHTPGAGTPIAALPPTFEIDMVDQAAARHGATAEAAGQPPPVPEAQPPPASGSDTAFPPPPSPAAPPGPRSPPTQVNLSGSDEDRDPLLVTGDNVVPPQPDATIHNRPPDYPIAAARRHSQGTVGLLIHITEAGTPAWVDIRASSGDAALDAAARDAVALWRFRPARNGGVPVPYDLAYNIVFSLDDINRSVPYGQDRPRNDPRR